MDQRRFVEAFLPTGFGRNARLERIAALIDWAPLEALVRQVRPGETGRPPYRALAMLRALLLQQWYGLSDPGLEEALSDRVSFRRFCGLALEEPTPDETTLCRFRLALVKAGLGDALFAEVSRQLETAGFMVKAGTLIDASLVQATVRQPPNGSSPMGQESRSPHDPDANWTRTACGTKRFFGYKVHVGVDQGSGIIRSRTVTPAKVYESEVADDLVIGDEKAVYADKAYEKRARHETLKARGIKDRIQHRRVRGQPALPPWQAIRNKLIGRVRTAVERTFSELKRGPYGFVRMRYRGLTRCRLHFDLSVIAYNLRRAAG
ncbi:transposase, IS4 family [Sphingomonas rubra]|uniref:Transposase, IS4 family n=2 Tax=Sphingomonas rubra TaxID=634430 RepID=A0A1I5RG27_9SPHN|nr:transposase, IS4 family [Sphingomonas rubra]